MLQRRTTGLSNTQEHMWCTYTTGFEFPCTSQAPASYQTIKNKKETRRVQKFSITYLAGSDFLCLANPFQGMQMRDLLGLGSISLPRSWRGPGLTSVGGTHPPCEGQPGWGSGCQRWFVSSQIHKHKLRQCGFSLIFSWGQSVQEELEAVVKQSLSMLQTSPLITTCSCRATRMSEFTGGIHPSVAGRNEGSRFSTANGKTIRAQIPSPRISNAFFLLFLVLNTCYIRLTKRAGFVWFRGRAGAQRTASLSLPVLPSKRSARERILFL